MRKQLLIILACFLGVLMAKSQSVHYFRCLEVMDGGEVRLTWTAPGSQTDFLSYQIYHRIPPAGFPSVPTYTETDFNITEFLHNIPDANQQSVEYFIITEQSSGTDLFSDTLRSIHLTVTLNSSDPIVAALNWNPLHEPLLGTSSPDYRVYANGVLTGFSLQASTPLNHYEVPVTVCADTIDFRIEIDDSNGCTSVSNINSMYFEDITPPPMPRLDSVSVNPFTGEVILGWSPSTAGDAGGYVIYHVKSDINDTLDWVFGINNNSYLDLSFDPCLENRSYALAAVDTCGNISPGSYDIPQRTILLNEVNFNPCTMINYLDWTAYINMSPALAGYRIYLSEDGGPFDVLSTVNSATGTYAHEGLDAGHSYSYFIRAFSDGDAVTSSSCIRELTTWQYLQPADNDMENASVEDSETVMLSLLPDTHAFVPILSVYRSTEATGPWDLIDMVELEGQNVVYFEDLTAEVNSQSYYYYTAIYDSCLNEVLPTTHMRTIFLQGEKNGQLNSLEWNAFEGWPGAVDRYEIYRAVNDDGPFEKAGETDGNTLDFEDELSSIPGEFSMLRYVVRALQDNSASLSSWSNEISFEYSPNVYLPTAFRPGGQNPVYKPVGNFADFTEYRFDVYNRWGELIFTSKDFGLGWDGSYEGNDAPLGVYVCILNYRSGNGDSAILKSSFVLLR